jgi:hypothetical protein
MAIAIHTKGMGTLMEFLRIILKMFPVCLEDIPIWVAVLFITVSQMSKSPRTSKTCNLLPEIILFLLLYQIIKAKTKSSQVLAVRVPDPSLRLQLK